MGVKWGDYEFNTLEILDILPIGIGIIGLDGTLYYMNNEMHKLSGFDEKDVGKVNVFQYFKDNADEEKIIDLLKKNGYLKNYEIQLKKKNGESYWALISVSKIHDKKNQVHWLVTQFDITERKRMERKLLEQEKKLQLSSIISMISSIFLHMGRGFAEQIYEALKTLGQALKVSEIILFSGMESKYVKIEDTTFDYFEMKKIEGKGRYTGYIRWKNPSSLFLSDLNAYEEVRRKTKQDCMDTIIGLVENFTNNISPNIFTTLYLRKNRQRDDENDDEEYTESILTDDIVEKLRKYGFNSILLVPIFSENKYSKSDIPYGVLMANNVDDSFEYDHSQIQLMLQISTLLSFVFSNQIHKIEKLGLKENN